MTVTYDILKDAQRAADNTKSSHQRFAILMLIKLGIEQLEKQNEDELDILCKSMGAENGL